MPSKCIDVIEGFLQNTTQSTPDTSMVQRVYEYDSGIAFTYRKVNGAEMTVRFPRSAVLFLRYTGNTPDVMRIFVETQSGVSVHEVAVLIVMIFERGNPNGKEKEKRNIYYPFISS